MSFEVVTIPPFDKQLRRLIRKYPSLKNEIEELGEQLIQNPKMGDALGRECYKIRLAIESKGKGKAGGARVITHIHIAGELIYLLSIFDKSEAESISEKELIRMLSLINS